MTGAFSFFLISILSVLTLHPQKVIEINPQPYGGEVSGPGYSILRPDFTYNKEFASSAEIDFRNFVLHTFDEKGRHFICGQLKGGYWEARDRFGLETLRWRRSFPLSSESGLPEYVLVVFDEWGASGSSDGDGYAQVWRLQDKKLTIVQQIQFNTHFGEEKPAFAFKKQFEMLTVRASHYLPGDSHCCISAVDDLTFRWEDGLFKLVKRETKPNHIGARR
jgi:hypothetical protein